MAELRTFLEKTWPNQAEAKLALEALDAAKLDPSRIKLVVTNGFAGDAVRFTKGLFDKGLRAFDVRLSKLFIRQNPVTAGKPGHAQWQAAYKALTLRKGARVITGVRGASSVEANLLVMATVGAAVFILKAGSDFKQIAGEVALNLALDTVLSKLPAGWIAGFALGLQSDNQYVIQSDEKFDKLLSMLPDVSSLTPADLKSTRDALKEMIENPIIIPEPPQPPPRGITLPGLHWEFNPDWA